jgi:hypothetical protein
MIKAEHTKFQKINLRIDNPENPERDGYLEVTKAKISWKRYGKGYAWKGKTINQLIDFLNE